MIAAFFAADKAKAREKARADAESWFSGRPARWDLLEASTARLREGENAIPPFHWAVEFPEVFRRENGGFDAIVGNPPFMGGRNISGSFGDAYLNWLHSSISGSGGQTDLVAYFFRRAFALLRSGGAAGLVATSTIAQGDTRRSGLSAILASGGSIYRAIKRRSWPGDASVRISIVHFVKHAEVGKYFLNDLPVPMITSYLFHNGTSDEPRPLFESSGLAFKGQEPYGRGFQFSENEAGTNPLELAETLVTQNPSNLEIIHPYLGGSDTNGLWG